MEPTAEAIANNTSATNNKLVRQARHFIKTKGKTVVLVAVVTLLTAGYLHQVQANNVLKQGQSKTSASAASNQATQLRNQVAQLIDLPTNETPTIATVTDASKLQNQAFFAHAQDGDKVLMFAQAKEVILYRPSANKIIQVAPLNSGSSNSASTAGQ